jgi:hypothetical protein
MYSSGERRAIACLACDHTTTNTTTLFVDGALTMADAPGLIAAAGDADGTREEQALSSKRPCDVMGNQRMETVLPFVLLSSSPREEQPSAGRSTATQVVVNIASEQHLPADVAPRPAAARVLLASRSLFPGPRSVVEGFLARAEQQVRVLEERAP